MSTQATNEYVARLIRQYKQSGLLLDANLLLVYTIGWYDRSLFRRMSRLDDYDEDDFDLLVRLVNQFQRHITTPNILTEVSNLSTTAIWENYHAGYLTVFRTIIETLTERFPVSTQVAQLPIFTRLALTDASIERVARNRYLVVSADLDLVDHLEKQKIAVINFNHLRDLAW